MIKISVISPIHNEKDNLEKLVDRVNRTMRGNYGQSGWEYILVDDNSTDGSLDLMKSLASKYQNLKVLSHDINKGQTGGFQTGFENAQGEILVTMDGDLQVYPEDIPLLIKRIKTGNELVNAIRKGRKDMFLIKLSSKLYNILMRIFFRCPLSDAASNYTALLGKYVNGLKLVENDHRYLVPILQRRGLTRITEVVVRHERRQKGKSKYGLNKAISGFPELLRAWVRLHKGFYDWRQER